VIYIPRHKLYNEEISMNDIPRRAYMDKWTAQEKTIRLAHDAVEASGAHPLLTEAGSLLLQAFEKMADWHDAGEPGKAR
jgi:hypothetical protein